MISADVKILLVEDDDVDAEAVERVFEEYGLPNRIYRACNGFEAFDILRGAHNTERIERPYIVLLDLNMPKMNGIEFLSQLRNDESLSDSVVFVLTTSNDSRDKWESRQKQIAGYLVKSQLGEDFGQLIHRLGSRWLSADLLDDRDHSSGFVKRTDEGYER